MNGIYPQDFLRIPPSHPELLHSFIQNIYGQTFVEIDGLHSVFGTYGISAVSITGNYPTSKRNRAIDIQDMAAFVEACFRSLNNVLEKLHQSYFLYYLISPDKFMSVAYYMPIAGCFTAIMIFCVSLFLSASLGISVLPIPFDSDSWPSNQCYRTFEFLRISNPTRRFETKIFEPSNRRIEIRRFESEYGFEVRDSVRMFEIQQQQKILYNMIETE